MCAYREGVRIPSRSASAVSVTAVEAVGAGVRELGGRRDHRLAVEAGAGHQRLARAIAASIAAPGERVAGP